MLLGGAQGLQAQWFARWDSIPVSDGHHNMKLAWAGGLNNPQFSTIDLNGDGIRDLFVFERSNNRILTFLNQGTPDSVDYKYAPQYAEAFPEGLHDWVILKDYNGDGRTDLFTSNMAGLDMGVEVYRNDPGGSFGFHFTKVKSLLYADYNPGVFNLFVSNWDLPAFTDVDYDGDLDILTFEFSGYLMEWFRNMSMENYGVPDSLEFVLQDKCFGKFEEGFGSCTVTLGISCKTGVGPGGGGQRHAGSTTLAFDLDNDHDKELLIGDINCNNPYLLHNGGDSANALITAIDTLYPQTFPVNIPRFPAAFYLDVNNDGRNDLLAAPNALNVSENTNGVWYYKNTGSNAFPQFTYRTNDFLQGEMIEVGDGANPVLADFNHDSLPDLIIGNHKYYQPGGGAVASLAYFENTGTADKPAFTLIDADYGNISSYLFKSIYPAFGDLDDDGDPDMILGDENGYLHYFENQAPAGSLPDFVLVQPQMQQFDVGQNCTPFLYDLNGDGLLDIIAGEKIGTLNYFENTGTKSNPQFTLVDEYLGKVDVRKPGELNGFSTAWIAPLDSTGRPYFVSGSSNGWIYLYDSVSLEGDTTWTLVDSMLTGDWHGLFATASGGDLNRDGAIDLVIGYWGGGVSLYKNLKKPPEPPPVDTTGAVTFRVYPNPTSGKLILELKGLNIDDVIRYRVTDLPGQVLQEKTLASMEGSQTVIITLNNYAQALYVLTLQINHKPHQLKIVKIN